MLYHEAQAASPCAQRLCLFKTGTQSPAKIRDPAEALQKTIRYYGGFVFTQVHNIQPNVPAENVIAMLDAAYEYGRDG